MLKYFSNSKWRFISAALAILAAVMAIYAHRYAFFPGDLDLTLFLQSYQNQILTGIMQGISWIFGSWHAIFLIIPTGLLVWWRLGKIEGLLIPAAGLFSLINDGLKILINRPRPSSELVQVLSLNDGTGYPSGHAFFTVMLLGICIYICLTHLRNLNLRIFSTLILLLLLLLVGISRVYLGAHWPSDVLGGYITGSVFLSILIRAFQTYQDIFQCPHSIE